MQAQHNPPVTLPINLNEFNAWANGLQIDLKEIKGKEKTSLGGCMKLTYNGGSSEELANWLESLHWASQLRNLKGSKLIAFASESLTGPAQSWFLDWSRSHRDASFEDFQIALKNRFKDHHSQITYRKKIEILKIEKGNIKLFNNHFAILMNTTEDISEGDKFYYFFKAMPKNIQQQLVIHKVKDWRTASQLAESLMLTNQEDDSNAMDLSNYKGRKISLGEETF